MKKIILLFISVFLFAVTNQKIVFDGYISKISFNKNYLIAGLENGDIVIKNFKTLKNIDTIHLPKIHDFMDEEIAMPIYSIDIEGNKVLILAESEDSKREVFIFDIKTKKLKHIMTTKDTFMKASFIKDKILFAYLSDEVSLFNPKTKKFIYKVQAGEYVFSTYSLNNNKTKIAIGDESGAIKILDIKTGKKLTVIKGFNKDQTLSIDFKDKLVINGGSDKRVGIYNVNTKQPVVELVSKFLPYGATLSPDEKEFAIQYNEKNDIAVYDIYKTKLYTLKGHTMALNGIYFLNKDIVLSYSPAEILIWKLKEK